MKQSFDRAKLVAIVQTPNQDKVNNAVYFGEKRLLKRIQPKLPQVALDLKTFRLSVQQFPPQPFWRMDF